MLHRRDLLRALAAAGPAVMGVGLWPRSLQAQAVSAGLIAPNVCALMPEVTEGPYYIDPQLIRADIREDRAGIPMAMRLQIVDADCLPIPDARVDIWHCDAQGNYSGFSGQGSDTAQNTEGQTFLRGTQMTDDGGLVAFQTIYPGWYRGRTTHIHFKVFLNEANLLTGQIFFPDALSQYIFGNAPDYGGRSGARDTLNVSDGIAAQAGAGAYAHVAEQPAGYDAVLVVGVSREGRVTRDNAQSRPPAGGPLPGGGGGGNPGMPPQDAGDGTLDPLQLIPGLRRSGG